MSKPFILGEPVRYSGQDDLRQSLLAGLPVAERRLQLAGVSTPVLEGGRGSPVVLLHGPGEYAAKWMRVIPELVTSHRVVAPDLPGHGASEVSDGPPNPDRVLAWLGELIERTCSTPPALVGQILGGAMAAWFAAEHSDRLRHLVLVDTLGLAPFRPTPEFGLALAEFVAQPNEETHDRHWNQCAFALDRLRARMGEAWDRLKAYNLDRARTPTLHALQGSLMEYFGIPEIPAETLGRISVPATLIWGRHDRATPLEIAEAASTRYGWPLLVIEDAASNPPLEQPDAFLQALDAALAGP
jgi:pimeloyl-ACP methyl ester carboxylesterase